MQHDQHFEHNLSLQAEAAVIFTVVKQQPWVLWMLGQCLRYSGQLLCDHKQQVTLVPQAQGQHTAHTSPDGRLPF